MNIPNYCALLKIVLKTKMIDHFAHLMFNNVSKNKWLKNYSAVSMYDEFIITTRYLNI